MEEMYYLRQPDNDSSLPEKVYIEPTSKCNLNCSICFRHGWVDEEKAHMSMQTFQAFSSQIPHLPSVREVFFGGMGEPLYHPEICRMIQALPQNIKKTLRTNGTLLTPESSAALINAGLDELWISMDGFTEECYESIQTGSRFDQIVSNIATFNHARKGTSVRLCITFVITPENVKQLDQINEFADRYSVDELNISHMIPGKPIPKEQMLYDRDDLYVGKMHRYGSCAEHKEEFLCPFVSKNSVFIRWDGAVIPCMLLLHNHYTYLFEEKRKITSFSYGNILDNYLLDCWNSTEYRSFRHRVNTFYFPFCTSCWGCDDRKENLRDCFLSIAPTCGACLWATGKVFCP